MKLNLTNQDRDILLLALDEYFTELREEIVKTENWEYKNSLKLEEKTLNRILQDLRSDKDKELEHIGATSNPIQ